MIEQFHRPSTIREALALQRRHPGQAAFLAGGTYLNSSACAACPERHVRGAEPAPDRHDLRRGVLVIGLPCSSDCALRPAHIISLAGLGLDRIEVRRGALHVGALCTYQRLIEDRRVPAPLRAAAAQLPSRNVRNIATVGGHLASRVPNSDLVPMLIALDARVVVARAGGTRTLRVAEYAAKPVPGLITALVVPKAKAGRVAACRAFRPSAGARSVVSVAVSVTGARGVLRAPIVAVGGVARAVVRLGAVERRLAGRPRPALDELQALVSRAVRPAGSPLAGAALRRHQAGAMVALALRDALGGKGTRP